MISKSIPVPLADLRRQQRNRQARSALAVRQLESADLYLEQVELVLEPLLARRLRCLRGELDALRGELR